MKKVLFGGAFDLLHSAHIEAIEKAKTYGDYLIVNVMSDERCRLKKGPKRPIIPAKERVKMIASLRAVDEVNCMYGDASYPMIRLLESLKPDILVMDVYNHPEENKTVKRCQELGIDFIHLDRIIADSGLDTTKIIERIVKLYV